MKRIDTSYIRALLANGGPIKGETILLMADELDLHRATEIVNDHYQDRMRQILHPAG